MKMFAFTIALLMSTAFASQSFANCEYERRALNRCLHENPGPNEPRPVRYYCVCEVQNWWANLNYYVVMSNGQTRFMHTLEAFTAVGGCQEALRTNPSCRR